jgi:tripartite-type tricarboxylate transporter receptor subunit TctC
MAPAGTPKAVIDKLAAEIKAVTEKPDVRAAWDKQGVEPMYLAPKEFDAYLRAELEKWAKVVKAANIKLE